MINEEQVIASLKTVFDPEIPVNIYDLGLVYNISINANDVHVTMTLTTATCPAAAFMPEEVRAAVGRIPGVGDIQIDVVYEPRWTKERMSPEARQQLGFY
jgi:FeS assembly SUF system protein